MVKLTTKKELIERLKDLRAIEISARKAYNADVLTFTNFKIVDTITAICNDEERHIKMLDELIAMLEK